ncbi:hypothetical protein OSTOST_14678 [Ostertagia ostertagi]
MKNGDSLGGAIEYRELNVRPTDPVEEETLNSEEREYCDLVCPNSHTVFISYIDQGHRACFNYITYQIEKRAEERYLWRSGKCLNSPSTTVSDANSTIHSTPSSSLTTRFWRISVLVPAELKLPMTAYFCNLCNYRAMIIKY